MTWGKILLGAVVVAVLTAAAGAWYVNRWQQSPLAVDGRMVIVVERGEAFGHVAGRLYQRSVVDHPRLWTWLARLSGDARRVQAGEYEILEGDTPVSVLARLVAGDVVTYQVKVLEGWTIMRALAEMARHPALEHTLTGVTVHTLLDVLGLPGGHAEGLFFPDTYQFVRGDSDADVLRRAYVRMQSVLQEAWEERSAGLPYESAYEALIAASLIEKETGREEDRALISQVFALRLERGMRLQTDPTVIYGIGEDFDGDLRRADLRRPGPYNTYLNRGLPPTPIALPGARSIHAAVHPADSEYLYFVSRGDGTSQFSVSLDEHEAAVRRYQMP